MTMMLLPLKRYAEFGGRSRRREYWMFVLFNVLVAIGFAIVSAALGGSATLGDTIAGGGAVTIVGLLNGLFSLAMLIPSIAVAVRRLHDLDRSGWWLVAPLGLYLMGIVIMLVGGFGALAGMGNPTSMVNSGVVGAVVVGATVFAVGGLGFLALLVMFCLPGTEGPNRFGPDPKGGANDLSQVFG